MSDKPCWTPSKGLLITIILSQANPNFVAVERRDTKKIRHNEHRIRVSAFVYYIYYQQDYMMGGSNVLVKLINYVDPD